MKIIAAFVALSVAAAGAAVPPPPALSPAILDQPVDGYDMRGPYQVWRWWVEQQKGPVTESLLAQPDSIEGLKPFGLLLKFTKHNDFGHFLTGEVRGYCRPALPNQFTAIPGSCRYLLRWAYVPLDAASYSEPNRLSQWTIENFDAAALARHYRKIGLAPDTDWWQADRDLMFAAAPSPQAVLRESAVVERLDSVECPQMGLAIEALEGQPIDQRIDLPAVGKDGKLLPPRPHSVRSNFRIYLRADGSAFSMEGSGGPIAKMANPILAAAEECAEARNGRK